MTLLMTTLISFMTAIQILHSNLTEYLKDLEYKFFPYEDALTKLGKVKSTCHGIAIEKNQVNDIQMKLMQKCFYLTIQEESKSNLIEWLTFKIEISKDIPDHYCCTLFIVKK